MEPESALLTTEPDTEEEATATEARPTNNRDSEGRDQTESVDPSPFLPGTFLQWAWDSTSLGWLKTCPRLYQYKMIEGWQEKDESVHLRFGIEYHQALQDYAACRIAKIPHDDSVFDVVRALLQRTGDWRPDHEIKNRDNLIRAVIWYLDKYRTDPAETITLENGSAAVELSFQFSLDWGPEIAINPNFTEVPLAGSAEGLTGGQDQPEQSQPYTLCGHLDRVVDFQGETYIMDRKTTKSSLTPWYYSQYEPDNQMTLYTLASQVIFSSPIKGVIVDAAQISEAPMFGRGFTYRTKDQIDEWLRDLRFLLAQAEDYAAEEYWPMNDKSCNNFRSEADGKIGCPFKSICSKSPQVRGQFLKSQFTKGEPWNPLISRE